MRRGPASFIEPLLRLGAAARSGRGLAGDSVMVGIDMLATRGSAIVAAAIVARWLGPAEFGVVVAVQTTATLIASALSYALRLAASSELAASGGAPRRERNELLASLCLAGLLGAALLAASMYLAARPIASLGLADAGLAAPLRVGALLCLVECVSALQLGMLTGLRRTRLLAASGLVSGPVLIGAVTLGVTLAGLGGALWGLVAGGLLGVAARAAALARALRDEKLTLLHRPHRVAAGRLMRVGGPHAVVNALWMPTLWLGQAQLLRSAGGLAELGELGAAMQWFALALFVPNVLGFVTLPALAAARAAADPHAYAGTARTAWRTAVWAAAPAALLLAVSSPWLMTLYGSSYGDAWPTLALLAASTVPAAAYSVASHLLTVTRRYRLLVVSQFTWAGAYLLTATLLLGIDAGSAALGAAMLVGNVARLAVAMGGGGRRDEPSSAAAGMLTHR